MLTCEDTATGFEPFELVEYLMGFLSNLAQALQLEFHYRFLEGYFELKNIMDEEV